MKIDYFFSFVALLLLTSCSLIQDTKEGPSESGSEEPTVTETWVQDTISHKIILKIVDEENGELASVGSEGEPIRDSDIQEERYETDLDVLEEAGILTEDAGRYAVASEAELDELAKSSDLDSSLLSAAMDSVLSNNEVQWCSGSERGRDFRDRYLDVHNAHERQTYSTKEEYLKSIDDYVDCGDGHI